MALGFTRFTVQVRLLSCLAWRSQHFLFFLHNSTFYFNVHCLYMSSFFLILTSLSGWLTFSFSGKEHREILCLQMTDSYMNRVLIILWVHFICPDSEVSTTEYPSGQQFIESYLFILKTNHSMFSITEFCSLTYLIYFLHYDFSYV